MCGHTLTYMEVSHGEGNVSLQARISCAVRTSRERGVSEALLARRGWGSSHVAHAHHCSVGINSQGKFAHSSNHRYAGSLIVNIITALIVPVNSVTLMTQNYTIGKYAISVKITSANQQPLRSAGNVL